MIELFPAIDLIGGKVVRLKEGAFDQKTEYAEDPVALAGRYAAEGFRNLHLVDLDGARTGSPQNIPVLEKIASVTHLHIDFGGGLRSEEAVEQAFFAGAWKMNIGSVAVKTPGLMRQWMMHYGSERFIAAVDMRDETPVVEGWRQETQNTWQEIVEDLTGMGVEYFSVTAIRRDGNMQGADMALYRKIREAFPEIRLIASGGVSSVEEITVMEEMGVWGVILGKALLEGQIRIADLKKFM